MDVLHVYAEFFFIEEVNYVLTFFLVGKVFPDTFFYLFPLFIVPISNRYHSQMSFVEANFGTFF